MPASLVCPIVAFFAMLGQVQTVALVFHTHPKSDRLVYKEQNDKRTHNRNTPRDRHAQQLVQQLMAVAFKQAGGLAGAKDGVDGTVSEDAGQDSSHRSARAMNAKGIE